MVWSLSYAMLSSPCRLDGTVNQATHAEHKIRSGGSAITLMRAALPDAQKWGLAV